MPDQFGEKTQDATPHRRQKAREEGQVARSQDLASALTLLAGAGALLYFGGAITEFFGGLATSQLGHVQSLEASPATFLSQWNTLAWEVAKVMLPLLAVIFVAGIFVNVAQTGPMFLPQKLSLDPKHISPLQGLKRLFGVANVVRLAFGIFKILVVAAVAIASLYAQWDVILGLSGMSPPQIARFIGETVIWTTLKIGAALLLLAIFDYLFQRWKFEQDIRMTTQEVREEIKTTQGDPQLIARRRTVQRQLALNRLSSSVPKADVVVTNPTELAVAIQYDPETMEAPIVLAKGEGFAAERIRRLALENNIPIIERKPLARALFKQVEVNGAVPPEQYAAVAEVLKYVYELKGKRPPGLDTA